MATLSGWTAGCGAWGDRLACGQDDCGWTAEEWARVKDLANITAIPPPRDLSNEYLPPDDLWLAAHAFDADPSLDDPSFVFPPIVQLGWELYYDPRLSGPARLVDTLDRDTTTNRAPARGCSMDVSCATCHDPARAGSDATSIPRHVSAGAGRYDVNGQQTLNVARYPFLYWNGRTDAVWAQAAQVIESSVSMNGDRLNTARVISEHYAVEYTAVFGVPPPSPVELATPACAKNITDPPLKEAVTRVHVNAAKAIAAYEWLLSSDGSPFDRFVTEGPRSTLLSPAEQRGLKVFVGRGSCYDCHRTPLFSDGKFHNVGVPQVGESVPTVAECMPPPAGLAPVTPGCAAAPSCDCTVASKCLPWGAFAGRARLFPATGQPEFGRASPVYSGDPTSVLDPTTAPALKGAWRTPSLRDVALTPPYMHDGMFDTLADVVWHYDQGGTAPPDPYGGGCTPTSDSSCTEIGPLFLSSQDRSDLVAFLGSLTGQARPARLTTRPPLPDLGLVEPAPICPTALAASNTGVHP